MTFLLTLEINIKSIKPGQKLVCDIIVLVASVWNWGKTSPLTELFLAGSLVIIFHSSPCLPPKVSVLISFAGTELRTLEVTEG